MNTRKLGWFWLAVVIIWAAESKAQSTFLPAGHEWHRFVQRMEIKTGKHSPHFHAAVQPFERRAMADFLHHVDTSHFRLTWVDEQVMGDILQSTPEWNISEQDSSQRPVLRHFYHTPANMFQYHDEDLFLVINPVIHFEAGRENDRDLWLYHNTRGLEVRGMINQRIGFYSYLADNQARFPSYVNRKIQQQQGAISGEGWNIPFGDQGYDFFTARGYIAFQATQNIGIQFGQDRNFLGYGQRSLLLSDYANNYTFLKINTRLWRFHYQNMYARLVDFPMRTFGGRMYDAKYMAAHTLSVNLSDRFQLGFFENVVFGRSDTLSQRGFDVHYLNPVIFYRAMEHHIGDPDKVAVGLFWRWIVGRRLAFHGQIYADDFHIGDVKYDIDHMLHRLGIRSDRKYDKHASFRHKYGLQAGFTWVDFLGVDNLDLMWEGNWVRPFVYTHFDVDGSGQRPAASYTHYSQALAHPLGANFREFLFDLQYRPHPNWILHARLLSARQGVDSAGVNMGSDILLDYTSRIRDYGNTFLQGEKNNTLVFHWEVSWQWRRNMWLDVRYMHRKDDHHHTGTLTSGLWMVGVRVNALRRTQWF